MQKGFALVAEALHDLSLLLPLLSATNLMYSRTWAEQIHLALHSSGSDEIIGLTL